MIVQCRNFMERLVPHAFSMMIGDKIEMEVGAQVGEACYYKKSFIRGAGLGNAIKLAMVLKP